MRNKIKPARRTADAAPKPPPSTAGQRDLALPHERDETIGATDPTPRRVIQQAKRDLDAGLVDTDMRATPGLDAQRRRALVDPKRGDT